MECAEAIKFYNFTRNALAHLIDTYPATAQAAWAGDQLTRMRQEAALAGAQREACVGGPAACIECTKIAIQRSPDMIARLNACYADCKQRCR